MPTDIAVVLMRKAEAEAHASNDALTDLTIVYLWAALGLVLTALMFNLGFDPALAVVLVGAG
jgi:hypothetical protein